MALERYIAVCRPLHHVHICTVRRAYAVIALTWVVSFGSTFINIIMVLATQPLSVFSRNVICYQSNVFHAPHYKALNTAGQVKHCIFHPSFWFAVSSTETFLHLVMLR